MDQKFCTFSHLAEGSSSCDDPFDSKVRKCMNNIREMVRQMNLLLERGDISGFKQLVGQNRREAVIAANYVNRKYRYMALWMVSAIMDEAEE
jgi:hypothetical protein